jgi:hypothetical protein
MQDQRLTIMIDYFRGKLADEQLRLADAIVTNEILKGRLEELEKELEEYRVQSQAESREDLQYSPEQTNDLS